MVSSELATVHECTLGLDLGGSSLKGGMVTSQGDLIYSTRVESKLHSEPDQIVARMESLVRSLIAVAATGNYRVIGLGISSTLDVDTETGIFLQVHYPHLEMWVNFPVADFLQERCGLPVLVDNDGISAAWGEYRAGVGVGHQSLLMVMLGSGIGGGVILEGNRLPQTLGSAAYFGHMCVQFKGLRCPCGRRGCWEVYASASALEKRAAKARKTSPDPTLLKTHPTGKELVEAANKGDRLACKLLEEHGYYLGIGLVDLANLFNPGCIAIGGGLSLAGDLLLEPARQMLIDQRLPLRGSLSLTPAKFPMDAGLIGAALLAWERFGGKNV